MATQLAPTAEDVAGNKTALHVMVLDPDGHAMEFSGGSSAWQATHTPAANTQATITKAAAGAGVRNVCTGFTVTLAAGASAPAAVQVFASLIDGASGGTTYLWRSAISLPAVAGAITSFVRSDLWLPGTANTALTLELSAAGGANTVESVTMDGTTAE